MRNADIKALRYGPTVGKALCSLFLGPGKVLVDIGLKPLEDRFKKKADALEAQRLLETKRREILDLLPTHLLQEGGSVSAEAVEAEAALTLEAAISAPDHFLFLSLVQNLETPERLPRFWASVRTIPLDRREEALASYHDSILTNTARLLIPVLPQMPGFMNWFVGFVSRQDHEVAQLSQTMQDLLGQENRRDAVFEYRYRNSVLKEHDRVELFIERPDLDIESREQTLSVAYVTLTLTQGRTGTPTNTIIQADDLLDYLSGDNHRAIIIGKAGSGKTTLLRWAAIQASSQEIIVERQGATYKAAREIERTIGWRGKVPFFIRLRRWEHNFPPSPSTFHIDSAPGTDAPDAWAERILQAGRGLLLLDGLDELSPATRKQALKWIETLAQYHEDNIILATSRPAAIDVGALAHIGFAEFEVQDLTPSGQIEFVQRWHKAVARQLGAAADRIGRLDQKRDYLLQQLQTNRSIARLAANPLLCALLCALNRLYRQALPQNQNDLCASACKMLLWDRDKLINLPEKVYPPAYLDLNDVQRLDVAQRLASGIVRAGETILPRTSALKYIRDALGGSRNNDSTEATQVLQGLVERSGLLRPAGVDDVEFVHNTLRDFLAAAQFVADGETDFLVRKLDAEGPQRWEPILLFAAATATHKPFVQDLLRKLLDLSKVPEQGRLCRQLMCLKVEGRIQYRLDIDLQEQVESVRTQILPIDTKEKAEAFAAIGEPAIDFLTWQKTLPEQEAAACLHGLSQIDDDRARDVLKQALQEDRRPMVLDQLVDCFKPDEIAAVLNVLLIPSVQQAIQRRNAVSSKDFARFIQDLSPLEHLTALKTLDFNGTQVNDLSPLEHLTALETLDLTGTQVNDLSPLEHLTALETLDLTGTQVNDLSPLKHLTALETLDLNNAQVNDLSPLKHLTALTRLYLTRNQVSDLSPLEHLTALQTLDFTGTQVSDLSPLKHLTALKTLVLTNTQVSDLSPLENLTALKTLYLDNTSIAPTEIERFHSTRRSRNLSAVSINAG